VRIANGLNTITKDLRPQTTWCSPRGREKGDGFGRVCRGAGDCWL